MAGGAATKAATSAASAVAASVDDLRASIAADRAEARNSMATDPVSTGAVTININGATDPTAVAAEVQKVLRNPRRASAAYTTV